MSISQSPAAASGEVYVWDRFVRVFHWTLVVGFVTAYFTEDELLPVHVGAGYAVGVLIAARVVWGFVGSPHARFSDFVTSPKASFAYVRDLLLFRAKRYLGHSPGGAAMVVLLLVMTAATVVTGLMVYGADQQARPLAGWAGRDAGESLEDVHELLANLTAIFVLAHIAAVVFASFVHHENLVRSMFTGWERQ